MQGATTGTTLFFIGDARTIARFWYQGDCFCAYLHSAVFALACRETNLKVECNKPEPAFPTTISAFPTIIPTPITPATTNWSCCLAYTTFSFLMLTSGLHKYQHIATSNLKILLGFARFTSIFHPFKVRGLKRTLEIAVVDSIECETDFPTNGNSLIISPVPSKSDKVTKLNPLISLFLCQ